jgi:hypothetical protein
MIASIAAALAEPTSAHLSDRRFLSGHRASPSPSPCCRVLTRPTNSLGITGVHQASSARPFRLPSADHP